MRVPATLGTETDFCGCFIPSALRTLREGVHSHRGGTNQVTEPCAAFGNRRVVLACPERRGSNDAVGQNVICPRTAEEGSVAFCKAPL